MTDKYSELELSEETIKSLDALRPIVMGGLCLVSGIALIVPQMKDFLAIVDSSKLAAVATRSFVLVGSIDLLLSFLGFLAFRYVYSLIRVRGTLGMGYFLYSCSMLGYGSYIFPLIAVLNLCLFFSTMSTNLLKLKLMLLGGGLAAILFGVLPYFF